MGKEKYLAHIDEKDGREQTILEHLVNTGKIAAAFGKPFASEEEAYSCAMIHDIGKYSEAFQKRLHGGIKTDHSTAGAQLAVNVLKDPIISFCVAGHHAGLPDIGSKIDDDTTSSLYGRLKRKVENYSSYKDELILPKGNQYPKTMTSNKYDSQFYIRMLYSCLVDADFLDTEYFMSNGKIERDHFSIEPLGMKLEQYTSKWNKPKTRIDKLRNRIRNSAIDRAKKPPGLFTFTVPTGGGKTIASIAFALHHASIYKKRRVIYVIPYCSIIEQTQRTFEEIFGAQNVIAHFANVEYDTENEDENNRRYLAAENWDAPIVLTTSVQFFESLYGNRSSSCRKLHNISDSVIIFDEAQMLPVPYLIPCVDSISELICNYGCSAVLCTATQPALNQLFRKDPRFTNEKIIELCPREYSLDKEFERVTYQFDGLLNDEQLAEKMNKEKQVLCIVNNRQQAQDLFGMLDEKIAFHLSTRMTPHDRKTALSEIEKRLKSGEPCRVVSTSLIEAGVDIDFPIVYRSYSGLDSIVQAAGRCNREGKNSAQKSIVHVFDTDRNIPDLLLQNINAAKHAIAKYAEPNSPECIKTYFEFLLYVLKGEDNLDSHQIIEECCKYNFKKASDSFHIIDTDESIVYIPNKNNESLIKEYRDYGLNRNSMRLLAMDSISIPTYQFMELVKRGDVEKTDINAGILKNPLIYNERTGLSLGDVSFEKFIL